MHLQTADEIAKAKPGDTFRADFGAGVHTYEIKGYVQGDGTVSADRKTVTIQSASPYKPAPKSHGPNRVRWD